MNLRLSTDLLTGVLFLALAGFAIAYGWHYPVGTAARMGPGYYPLLASSALGLIGAILVGRSLLFGSGEELGSIGLRPLLCVVVGTVLFGLLLERAGLFVASAALIVTARLSEPDDRWVEIVVLAAVLAAATALVFRFALGLPVPLLPPALVSG